MAYTEPEPRTPAQERKDEAGVLLIICLMLFPFMAYFAIYAARETKNWYVVSNYGRPATAQVDALKSRTSLRRGYKWRTNLLWKDASGAQEAYQDLAVSGSLWHELKMLDPPNRKLEIVYLLDNDGHPMKPVVIEDFRVTRFTTIAFTLLFGTIALFCGWGLWHNLLIVLGRR